MNISNLQHSTSARVKLTRKYLKLKLLKEQVVFKGHVNEAQRVYDVIKRTICHGKSCSALIIGPRGCGKTTLINSVLSQLSTELDLENDAIIVKLNGFVHHDDQLAIRDIIAQMQLQNAVGDHVFGSFTENLSFLLSCLRTGADRSCKSMIFILEKFDMFCKKTQPLLYNLLDFTHNNLAPLCVIGVTNRLDVIDLLEKRIQSRFSFHRVFLFSNESEKSTVDIFMETVVECLSFPILRKEVNTLSKKGSRREKISEVSAQDIEFAIRQLVLTKCKLDTRSFPELNISYIDEWNAHIYSLCSCEMVLNGLEKLSYYTRSEQDLKDILYQLICKLSPTKPYIEPSELISLIDESLSWGHSVEMLKSLSALELSLVIAMKHGMDVHDKQPMNFEMILDRYRNFAKANSSTQIESRERILQTFEHLQLYEIVIPIRSKNSTHSLGGTSVNRLQNEYQLYTLGVHGLNIQEAVKNFKTLPTEIRQWYNSSGF